MDLEQWMIGENLSRKELAERLGVTRQTVHNLLTKQNKAGLKLAMKIQQVTKGKVPLTCWVPK